MTSSAMPPDPSPELTMEPMGWQYLQTAAFHLHLEIRKLIEAAVLLGWDTSRLDEMLQWAEAVNRHFNPPDIRRLQHGQITP
jgi:hypothetical protein